MDFLLKLGVQLLKSFLNNEIQKKGSGSFNKFDGGINEFADGTINNDNNLPSYEPPKPKQETDYSEIFKKFYGS